MDGTCNTLPVKMETVWRGVPTGPVPALEKYVKLYKKDKDKMFALIRKNFPKTEKEDKEKEK